MTPSHAAAATPAARLRQQLTRVLLKGIAAVLTTLLYFKQKYVHCNHLCANGSLQSVPEL